MNRAQRKAWTYGLLALGLATTSQTTLAQPPKVVVTNPVAKDVVVTQRYPGSILAQRHIEIRSVVTGALTDVLVREGQAVRKGEVLFKMSPALARAKLEVELAEVQLMKLELNNAKRLFDQKASTAQDVALAEAKLARASAKAKLAEFELNFTIVTAPFDGLVGQIREREGSLVKEGDSFTTLSDTSVMWVYFNVPEARYLEYKRRHGPNNDPSRLELVDSRIELVLADDSTFNQNAGNVVTVSATFNNETGNLPFRIDFPNPDRLLRHGQTGTILIHRTLKNALVVPQRATFDGPGKRYVYVVDKDSVVHQREIIAQHELEEVVVISKGLDATDRIVLDGVRRLRDGDKVEYVIRKQDETPVSPKTPREK